MATKNIPGGGIREVPPNYSLKMRGTQAIRIIFEGKDLGAFDLESLWEEYRKNLDPVDRDRRYVIERAIETLRGKSPQFWKGEAAAGGWVDRWDALPARYPVTAPRKRKRRSLLRRAWDCILGL